MFYLILYICCVMKNNIYYFKEDVISSVILTSHIILLMTKYTSDIKIFYLYINTLHFPVHPKRKRPNPGSEKTKQVQHA